MPRIINIDSADIHIDTLAVVEDSSKSLFYLTATCSKPSKKEHKVIANLCCSSFKYVLETIKTSLIFYVENQPSDVETVVGEGGPIVFSVDGDLPNECHR